MLSSGDVVDLRLGVSEGNEAGFERPAVVVTARAILEEGPSVVHAVPLTRIPRRYRTEVAIEPDPANGLDAESYAQCQLIRAVSTSRVGPVRGNVGPAALAQIREILALLLDVPR